MTVQAYSEPSTPHQPSRKQLWKAAIKLPMYTVAIMPILLGSAIATFTTGQLHAGILTLFLVGAIAIIAWLNLTNDVFDADTGIDVNKAHSVVNLTGNRSLVFWIANGFLALGVGSILAIALLQQDWTVLGIILACCFLGYTYQGPPFRFGYLGLGEPICFVTFGPMAVVAAYYSQTQAWPAIDSPTLWAGSIFMGITTSLILLCSHFHQVADDLRAGKRSPVARLGTGRSAQLLPWLCGVALGPIAWGIAIQELPLWSLLVGLSLPIAVKLCRHVLADHDQPDRVSNCKFIAVKWHFWSGLLLSISCFLGAWWPVVLP
ncbi:MAG: 2-carboxy-1,4-naphthoquinone phytyltransferase [Oscillatoriales cyanobacterium]|nr:MAG: 2-carboxy-1,4-naphthoquinone phytyltransferase [Oscillatoriales cyanobacterium]